jgi:hypothetical protein
MSHRALAILAVGCAVSSSQAALFSFASDNDHTSWTFTGAGNMVADAQDPLDPQILLVDDHNGPLPAIPFAVEFEADFTIGYLASVPLGGGAFVHNYSLNGTFSFLDAAGNVLLGATVENGALTAIGGMNSWYSTSTIQANDNPEGGSVTYVWNGNAITGYDLLPGPSQGRDDMAFTLTSLNANGMDVMLDPQTFLPISEWNSEGSYSGTGRNFIPAPGAAMIAALGGLVALRRRRTA